MKKIIIIILIGLGLWNLSSSGYMLIKAYLSQMLIAGAWNETLKDKNYHKPWSWADTYPVLRIHLPRINKVSYILEGASGRNMAFSATHTSISGFPGQNKSTIISGHRDSHFEYLKELKLGDKIIADEIKNKYHYEIVEIKVINIHQEKLLIRNLDELILTTCYPFDSLQAGGDLRYVIHALPI
jgi:sortase A